ncbi:DNA repair protein RecO [Rhabdochlamydiaceae symbiont of Dictyostelium giganteum]|uniref:DNA repair protein RecO n=1 Tax=Rhabdochlamydiaceae symbiont of Dictyostelium giganteum TaxID=3342349 RepID=UPI00384DB9AD
MSEIKTEGIILKTIPYQEKQTIVTLFTLDQGMVTLFVRQSKKSKHQSLINPLSHIDVVYQRIKTTELLSFKEGLMIENHYFLREKWSFLEAAGKMTSAILFTQLPGKSAPQLYQLLLACLKQIPRFASSSVLITLFYLKLLTYEGVLSFESEDMFPLPCTPLQWEMLKTMSETKVFSPYYLEKNLGSFCDQLEQLIKTVL